MKVEKIETKKHKLLKLNLLKSKILKKDHYYKGLTLENLEVRVKKALYIVWRYHIRNKRILFVGNPKNINAKLIKLFKKTKHIVTPMRAWIAGVITNRKSPSEYLSEENKNKVVRQLANLRKEINLIVIVDEKLDQIAVNESYNSRIPTITFNSNLEVFENKIDYKVPGNFLEVKNSINNSLLYSILIAVLGKANAMKHKYAKYLLELRTIQTIKRGKKKYYQKNHYHQKKRFYHNAYTQKKKI